MKEQKMGKYKALKEYIEKCQAKNKAITVQNDYPIVDLSEYMQVNRDLNALLKEWFDKQPPDGWVTISKDSVINDKA